MKRNNLYWFAPAVIWGLVILTLTSLPNLKPPPLVFRLEDKMVHFFVYFIFGLLLIRAWRRGEVRNTKSALFKMLLFGAPFALLDELHQTCIPGRFCDIWDAAADLAGIFAAALAFPFAHSWFSRRKKSLLAVFIDDSD